MRYIRTEMKYDNGFHIDEDHGFDVKRIYCSKGFKCKDCEGKINWCKKGKMYSTSARKNDRYIDINDKEFDSIRLLYF